MNVQLPIPFIFEEPPKINYEYFMILSPDDGIKAELKKKKKELHAEVGLNSENLHSVAHISLLKFQGIDDEQLIKRVVERIAEDLSQFKVGIKGLDVFKHGSKRSLVLVFEDPDRIEYIHDLLFKFFFNTTKKTTPHMTIARNMAGEVFKKIRNPENYFFSGNFLCNKISILRKPLKSKQDFELFDEISLRETPVLKSLAS